MNNKSNTDWDMRGKVSLITGANAGIGKRTAKRLAELGSQVIIVCRNAAGGSSAVEEIQREIGNPNVVMIQCDLSSQESVRRLLKRDLRLPCGRSIFNSYKR
jgi:NAD(P)-dependent dehydrogenase (short-subunit alcohol dehydrogenase family)